MSEETSQAMVDGFFRTGDIGYFDERGYLFIVDRLKDMIIAGGYNIYPANVENAVYTHPAVSEAIVIDGGRCEGEGARNSLSVGFDLLKITCTGAIS